MKGKAKAINAIKRVITLFCVASLLLSETASVSLGADLSQGAADSALLTNENEANTADRGDVGTGQTQAEENGTGMDDSPKDQGITVPESGEETSVPENEDQPKAEDGDNNPADTSPASNPMPISPEEGMEFGDGDQEGEPAKEGTTPEGQDPGTGEPRKEGTTSEGPFGKNLSDAAGAENSEQGSDADGNASPENGIFGTYESTQPTSGTTGDETGAAASIAVDGEEDANYSPVFTFETAAILKNEFNEKDVVSRVNNTEFSEEKTVWVKENGEVEITASKDFSIAPAYLNEAGVYTAGEYGESLTTSVGDRSIEIFARNESGEIGIVELSSVRMDKTAPTVELTSVTAGEATITEGLDKVFFNKDKVVNTYTITDSESGIASLAYIVTDTEERPADEAAWTMVEQNHELVGAGEEEAPSPHYVIELTVPQKGYVHFRTVDAVGNENNGWHNMVVIENLAPDGVTAKAAMVEDKKQYTVTLSAEDLESAGASDPADNPESEEVPNPSGNQETTAVGFSGIRQINFNILDGNGNDITKEAAISVSEGFSIDPNINAIVRNGDEPKDLKEVEEARSMEAVLTVSGLDGFCTLKTTAVDYCGNESGATETGLSFDNSAPKVTVTASGIGYIKKDGKAYLGAADKEISVRFEDANLYDGGTYKAFIKSGDNIVQELSLTVQEAEEGEVPDTESGMGEDGEASGSGSGTNEGEENPGTGSGMGEGGENPGTEPKPTSGRIVFDNEALKALPDGDYTLTVTAVDAYGNDAEGIFTVSSENVEESLQSEPTADVSGSGAEESAPSDGKVVSFGFAVDQTSPCVTKVEVTIEDEGTMTEKEPDGDNPGRYLFSKPFSMTVTIEDAHIDKESFKAIKNGSGTALTSEAEDNPASAPETDEGESDPVSPAGTGEQEGGIDLDSGTQDEEKGSQSGDVFISDLVTNEAGHKEVTVTYSLPIDENGCVLTSRFIPGILGADYAGNVITVSRAVTEAALYGWQANADGTGVESAHALWYQAEKPEIDLSFKKGNAYLESANIMDKTAYYNGDMTVTAELTNIGEEDYENISLTIEKTLAGVGEPQKKIFTLAELAESKKSEDASGESAPEEGAESGRGGYISGNTLTLTLPLDEELDETVSEDENASYRISFAGCNSYGNPVLVKTLSPAGPEVSDAAENASDEQETAENENPAGEGASREGNIDEGSFNKTDAYTMPWTLVRDTASPRAFVNYSPDEGVSNSTPIGNRYYYNRSFTATVSVEDYSLDPYASTITVKRAAQTEESDGTSGDNETSGENGGNPVSDAEGEDSANDYSIVTFEKEDFDRSLEGSFDGREAIWTCYEPVEGVYAYAIHGCDLAGNPVVARTAAIPDGSVAFEKDSDENAAAGEERGNDESETDAEKTLVTVPAVVDKTAPVGQLCIYDKEKKKDKKDAAPILYYSKDTNGTVSPSFIYIKSKGAYITAAVTGEEKLPVTLSLNVNEKKGTKTIPVSVDEAQHGASTDYTITGEQTFTVSDFTLTDLAGNPSKAWETTEFIYIDNSKPVRDEFKPSIEIKATVPDKHYNNEGETLFNSDAPFLITVTEPLSSAVMRTNEDGTTERAYEEEDWASSGLKKVSYAIYEITDEEGTKSKEPLEGPVVMDSFYGKTLTSDGDKDNSSDSGNPVGYSPDAGTGSPQGAGQDYTYQYHNLITVKASGGQTAPKPEAETGEGSQTSTNLETEEGNQTPAAVTTVRSYNQNNLVLTVIAEDNAGNVMKTDCRFGIDTTPPTIEVQYDNNDVKNGRYFQEDRIATITVTERNFVEDAIGLSSSAGKNGGMDESVWTRHNGSDANGDADTYTKTIKFSGDGDFTFAIDSVKDAAGNQAVRLDTTAKGTEAPWDFNIDKTPPKVVIFMGGERYSNKEGGDKNYYYKADNCGITVTITDHGHDMGVKGSDPAVYKVTVTGKNKRLENFYEPFGEKKTKVVLNFEAGDVAGLGDGPCEIEVTAKDISGREQTKLHQSSRGFEAGGMKGSFILDTTPPRVTAVKTTSRGEGTATDNTVYKDTNAVYYNRPVKVKFTVKDDNAAADDFKGSVKESGKEGSAPSIKAVVNNKAVTLEFELAENKTYKAMQISGKDKAGNKLVLGETYSHSDVDTLTDRKSGKVTVNHGKIIDTVSPMLYIEYKSTDRANLYHDETEGKTSAYYNRNITVQFSVADNFELDGRKLTMGREDNGSAAHVTVPVDKETHASGSNYKHTAIEIIKEGRYSYTGYGTDRALNPAEVWEQIPLTDSRNEIEYEKTSTELTNLKGSVYAAKYELVLDKTPPTFGMTVSPDREVAHSDLNEQGNRYYFNKNYEAIFTVTDTNADSRRVRVLLGTYDQRNYDSSKVVITSYGIDIKGWSEKKTEDDKGGKVITLTCKDTQSGDGVYRYAVYGSDKAGNALVAGETNNLDGLDKALVNATAEKNAGSREREADISNHIVIDKVSPEGTFYAAEGNNDYFVFRSNGNTVVSAPFRDETSASLRLDVNEAVEHTPVKVEYEVTAVPAANSQKAATRGYVYNPTLRSTQSGRQQFKLTKLTMTDLAGNVTTASSRNYIYLDETRPSADIVPPSVQVVATAGTGTRGGHGQPLYKNNVTLQIRVSDPYPNASSTGIAEVTADIYVNGQLTSDRRTLHQAAQKQFTGNYTDPALHYDQTWSVTIAASQYNYNDIRVVAHARDNAGNASSDVSYAFGIDITPPKISVSYDNNNVRNGKYFKADRTATVVVTERNFDASRINIKTESGARVSGFSHSAGSSANGDDDKWTAKVSYTADGAYTLNVSGADQLGWTASATTYTGEAAQSFILDKTAPVVTTYYDNKDVQNEKYYKADRTATILVEDANFEGEHNITVTEAGKGSVPDIVFNGKEAQLPFTRDGVYSFGGTVTDLAGNVSEPFKENEFVIDKTAPRMTYEGVEDLSANREPVKMVVTLMDTNLRDECISAKVVGTNHGEVELAYEPLRIEGGVQYDLPPIDVDDYYKCTFEGTDLAGNKVSETISFSENQKGTVFVFDMKDELRENYINKAIKPSFTLYNVDEVTILSVTLNGQEVDYEYKNNVLTFTEPIERDGKYTVGIDVTDAAGNISSMAPLEFYLDTKPPIISQIGLEPQKDGDYKRVYSEPFNLRLIHDIPEDGIARIRVNGETLKIDDYITESGSVVLPIIEYKDYKVEMVVFDVAGNESRAEWAFELTNNPVKIWLNNKPVLYTSAILSALLVFGLGFLLIQKKKINR